MSKKQPNVIVFFTDQQRWDTSSIFGNPLGLTPNFDRMAREGTHFYNTFTCQPVCGPARACLQTGEYATTNGVYKNLIPLAEDKNTLAKEFKKAGYQTGYIGKWHLGGVEPGFFGHQEPVPENKRGGYDYWLAADLLEFCSQEYNTVLFDNDNKPVKLPGYRVDACTNAAIDYIDKHKEKPFFLFLSLLEPHFQNNRDDYPAPTGYAEEYTGRWMPPDLASLGGTSWQQIGGYYGMVKRIDEAFGRMIDSLKSLNILDDTIVLFTSDHGCHFKTRNDEYKRSAHDSSIRIPAAAMGPGFNGGGCRKEMVSLVDFPATLLDAAGIDVPEEMEGQSTLSFLYSKDSSWKEDVFIQISESQIGRAVRTQRWKYCVTAEGDPMEVSSKTEYRDFFLYDLYADPSELTNLIGMPAYKDVVIKMRERLSRNIKEVEDLDVSYIDAPLQDCISHRRVFDHEVIM